MASKVNPAQAIKDGSFLKYIAPPKTTVEAIRKLLEEHDVDRHMSMRRAIEKHEKYKMAGKEYTHQSEDIHKMIFNCSVMERGKIDFKKMKRKSAMTAKQIQHVCYAVFCHWGLYDREGGFKEFEPVAVAIRELLEKNKDV